MKRTPLVLTALTTVLALAGCGSGDEDPLSGDGGDSDAIRIGSANFPESTLLAEIYAGALEAKGLEVEKTLNIGSRETYILAIQGEEPSLDVFPEYTGNLRLPFDPEPTATSPEEVYEELVGLLPEELTVLEMSEAEDKDAVVVTRETAEEYSLETIADLADVAGDLILGGPSEFRRRQSGVPGLKEVYGVEFGEFKSFDASGGSLLTALLNGTVDAANLYTTDPNVGANDLVPLEDPEALFAAQNIVPLVRTDVLTDEIEDALNAVSAALDTQLLGDLVTRVVIDKEDPEDVAEDFLADAGLD